MVVLLAGLDHVEHLGRVLQAGGDADVHVHAGDVVGRFLDAVGAADLLEVGPLEGLAGELLDRSTKGRFHDAAGGAEDDGCAGAGAQGMIKVLVGQIQEADAGALDHAGELTGGHGVVHVGQAGAGLVVAADLELLGGAGHDGDGDDALRVDAHLLCKVALGDRALHLLGALAAGEVLGEFGVVVLAELDPAGGAGGDDRQLAAVLDALDELVGLLHDGEVGAEVGVEDLVEAESSQGSGQLALHGGADGQAEGLAQAGADGGSGLHDDVLGRVVDGLDHVVDAGLLIQRAGGAHGDALAAGDAGGLAQAHLEGAGDVGGKAALVGADDADALGLFAGGDAAAAEDALGVVADHVDRGLVELRRVLLALEGGLALHAVLAAQGLQLAFAGAHAAQAGAVVVREQQLEGSLAVLHDLGRVGEDLHVGGDGVDAGGAQTAGALDLDHADAAGADLVDLLEVAKRGDGNAGFSGSLEDGRALGRGHLDAVNFNGIFFHATVLLTAC